MVVSKRDAILPRILRESILWEMEFDVFKNIVTMRLAKNFHERRSEMFIAIGGTVLFVGALVVAYGLGRRSVLRRLEDGKSVKTSADEYLGIRIGSSRPEMSRPKTVTPLRIVS